MCFHVEHYNFVFPNEDVSPGRWVRPLGSPLFPRAADVAGAAVGRGSGAAAEPGGRAQRRRTADAQLVGRWLAVMVFLARKRRSWPEQSWGYELILVYFCWRWMIRSMMILWNHYWGNARLLKVRCNNATQNLIQNLLPWFGQYIFFVAPKSIL